MLTEELKFPEWQKPLQELILEFDRSKLPAKMQQVESQISERLKQLRQGNDGHVETQAINDALNILRIIKRDKLGFPEWESKLNAGRALQDSPDGKRNPQAATEEGQV